MSIIVTVSSMIIPAIMLFIVGYGMIKKKNVYDDFVNGAKDGFTTVIKVMPTLIGLMVAVDSNNEHRRIVEALKQHDAQLAEKLANQHIMKTIENMDHYGWDNLLKK